MNKTPFRAGFGSRCITPGEPMLLAGYAGNSRYHQSVSREIYAKACALEHADGARVAWLALDLCGVDRETVAWLERAVAPVNLIVNCTHNHSAPNVDTTLALYYEHSPELDAQIGAYTRFVRESAAAAIGEALAKLAPATVSFEQGLAGFAVNRRRSRPGCRHLPGPVDHDVPVLAVRAADGTLQGACFTYACHTTSLGGRDLNGDYAGYACAVLEERHPGATFLFLAGCGANQNPLPRYKPELSRAYGLILAEAVEGVLRNPMSPIEESPRALRVTVELPFEPLPDRAGLAAWRAREVYGPAMSERIYRHLLGQLEAGTMARGLDYTVAGWRFGNQLVHLALTGETIVEYALWAKAEFGWDRTWVLGYCFHLTPYIPTVRVLREGGYEGTDSLQEYGFGAIFTEAVEGRIQEAMRRAVRTA